jgi:uncharacterized membrane protein YfcA
VLHERQNSNRGVRNTPPPGPWLAAAGSGLGLLAGLTGTGGGVFLTPLLLFCRSCSTRQPAAVSGLFILLKFIAGLTGLLLARRQALTGVLRPEWVLLLLVVPVMASLKLLGLELVS